MAQTAIRAAEMPRDLPEINRLCWSYRDTLVALEGDVGRMAQRMFPRDVWAEMLAGLPRQHARPKGQILLAQLDGTFVGCGMIHPLSDVDAEIKRVYVGPEARGQGLGRALTSALIDQGRDDGYCRILLDTTTAQPAAAALYDSLGFIRRGPYSDMPEDLAQLFNYFELNL